MHDRIAIHYYSSPYGELILGSFEDKLCLCDWNLRNQRNAIDKRLKKHLDTDFLETTSSVIDSTIEELESYFSGELKQFSIPLLPLGTEFQLKIWELLLDIPHGETKSYLELAKQTGDQNTIRAVAGANGANAISILIPCHRVIGSKGELTGYAGGVNAKKKLLELENAWINDQLNIF